MMLEAGHDSRSGRPFVALVTGFPTGKRENCWLMILFPQAAIDDSGSEPQSPTFILAGFAAPFGAWLSFSQSWQTVLDKPPKLDYFKMSEAASMSGQFHARRGWTERKRDARVLEFAQVARAFVTLRIHASMSNKLFRKYVTSLAAPERKLGMDSPYVMMFMQIILATATACDRLDIQGACDFVFDEQGAFGREALDWWINFRKLLDDAPPHSLRARVASLVCDRPIFRDEKQFLPLQAADLYAWHVRKHADLQRPGLIIPESVVLRQFEKVLIIGRDYDEAELQRLRTVLLDGGRAFRAANPHIKFHLPGKTKRENKKLRKITKGVLARASASRKPA